MASTFWGELLQACFRDYAHLQQHPIDPGVYFRVSKHGNLILILCFHGDDLLCAGAAAARAALEKAFAQAGLKYTGGELHQFLATDYVVDKDMNIIISNIHYVSSKIVSAEEYKTRVGKRKCSVPAKLKRVHQWREGDPSFDIDIKVIVGRLLWPRRTSRLDIAFAVGRLGRCKQGPISKEYYDEVLQCLWYLNGTKDYVRVMKNNASPAERQRALDAQKTGDYFLPECDVLLQCDASFADDPECNSVAAGALFVNGTPIDLHSKVISAKTNNNFEAELHALNAETKTAMYVRNFFNSIIAGLVSKPVRLQEDNQAVIKFSGRQQVSPRTRHLGAQENYVRDVLETKFAELSYVNTDDNTCDIGTKALARPKFEAFRRALGIISLSELVAEMKPAEAAMMRAKLGV
jgi:hypothetical protein